MCATPMHATPICITKVLCFTTYTVKTKATTYTALKNKVILCLNNIACVAMWSLVMCSKDFEIYYLRLMLGYVCV